jgi:hypothetical protein
MKCDICQDSRRVRLIRHHELQCAPTPAEEMTSLDLMYREFDCPQCVPVVPYKRVRALKLVSEYDVDKARQFQEPIKRGLASVFGEYLLRKGLINFTTDESDRMSSGKIKIVAEMGAVTPANAEKAGALVEAVETDPPPLKTRLIQRMREREKAARGIDEKLAVMEPWMGAGIPQAEPVQFRASKTTAEKVRDVRESREGARDRFSGLELFQDNGEFQ